jgi:hypothetical protein
MPFTLKTKDGKHVELTEEQKSKIENTILQHAATTPQSKAAWLEGGFSRAGASNAPTNIKEQ